MNFRDSCAGATEEAVCHHESCNKARGGKRGKKDPSSIQNSYCYEVFCKGNVQPQRGLTAQRGERRDPQPNTHSRQPSVGRPKLSKAWCFL